MGIHAEEKTQMRGEKNVTIWVTKLAVPQGIFAIRGCEITNQGQVIKVDGDQTITPQLKMGRDAFPTEEEAVAYATKMARKRISSLQKQIANLEKRITCGFQKVQHVCSYQLLDPCWGIVTFSGHSADRYGNPVPIHACEGHSYMFDGGKYVEKP